MGMPLLGVANKCPLCEIPEHWTLLFNDFYLNVALWMFDFEFSLTLKYQRQDTTFYFGMPGQGLVLGGKGMDTNTIIKHIQFLPA